MADVSNDTDFPRQLPSPGDSLIAYLPSGDPTRSKFDFQYVYGNFLLIDLLTPVVSIARAGSIITTGGYSELGDGGFGRWIYRGNSGAPSQSPAQLRVMAFTDRIGQRWEYLPDENGVNLAALGIVGDLDNSRPLVDFCRAASEISNRVYFPDTEKNRSITIDRRVVFDFDNLEIDFKNTSVVYGSLGGIRIQGGLSVSSIRANLSQDVAAGSSSIFISNASLDGELISIGDRIRISGQKDFDGYPLVNNDGDLYEFRTVTNVITGTSETELQVSEPINFNYSIFYANSAYEIELSQTDFTEIAVAQGGLIGDSSAGVKTFTVSAGVELLFSVGDMVLVGDDFKSSDIVPNANIAANGGAATPARQLITKITSINGQDITVDDELPWGIFSALNAGIYRINPRKNTRIKNLSYSYSSQSPSKHYHSVHIAFSDDCHTENITGAGHVGSGIYVERSYKCTDSASEILNPASRSEGEGGGVTLFGGNRCSSSKSLAGGQRSSFAIKSSAIEASFNDCESQDCWGVDFNSEGSGEICEFNNCKAIYGSNFADGVTEKIAFAIGSDNINSGCELAALNSCSAVGSYNSGLDVFAPSDHVAIKDFSASGCVQDIRARAISPLNFVDDPAYQSSKLLFQIKSLSLFNTESENCQSISFGVDETDTDFKLIKSLSVRGYVTDHDAEHDNFLIQFKNTENLIASDLSFKTKTSSHAIQCDDVEFARIIGLSAEQCSTYAQIMNCIDVSIRGASGDLLSNVVAESGGGNVRAHIELFDPKFGSGDTPAVNGAGIRMTWLGSILDYQEAAFYPKGAVSYTPNGIQRAINNFTSSVYDPLEWE